MTPPTLAQLDDEALQQAIAAQEAVFAEAERAFVAARDRFDRQRRRLRELEAERDRRQRLAAGEEPETATAEKTRRRRSTTGMDALLGRDGIDPNLPFGAFRLLSLQRQEIYLNHTGDRSVQALAFLDRDSKALLEAQTFGEARRLQDAGHGLGRPGVPLQRQAVWYVAEDRQGWLRLDQLFVETREE
jgi:hypothetical protein